MKGRKYVKIVAKIQVRFIFHKRGIGRNVSTKFIEIRMETSCCCPLVWAPTWRTETSKKFWYKCVNLFLEELNNMKVILFLRQELFR